MGTGKTGTAILSYRNWCAMARKRMRCLVICPSVVLHNWKDEFLNFSKVDEHEIHVLGKGSGNDKAALVRSLCDNTESLVLTVNYEALLNDNLLSAVEKWKPEVIIFDEIHLTKNVKAKRTKRCIRLAEFAKKRIGLTGTPILNNVMDVYGIFRVVDLGKTFGTNEYVYQNRYLIDLNSSWKGKQNYFPRWTNNPKTFEELNEKIYKKSLRKLKSECLDLPDLIKIPVISAMGKEQGRVYKAMEKDFVAFIKDNNDKGVSNTVTANLAVVKAIRLLQIASGFAVNDAGEETVFDDVPRLNDCKEYVDQIVNEYGEKCILWCSFKQNYKMLSKMCDELGIKYVFITGNETTEEKRQSELAFQNDPSVKVVICNRKAGGVGVNLTAAAYSYVYSRNFSLDEELQSEARNHRGGSEIHEKIIKYNGQCEGTIDAQVIEALEGKFNISTAILDMVRE